MSFSETDNAVLFAAQGLHHRSPLPGNETCTPDSGRLQLAQRLQLHVESLRTSEFPGCAAPVVLGRIGRYAVRCSCP